MRRLALLGLGLAGCLKEKVPFCENGAFCPEPLVCTERPSTPFCGTASQVEPCFGMADEAACTLGGAQGTCDAGLCKPCDENNAACAYTAWVQMPVPTSADLYALHVAGAREVYAAGKGGVVIRWDGRAWTTLPAPEAGDIRALSGDGATLYAAAATAVYRYRDNAWTSEASAPNAVLGIACAQGECFAAGFRATVGRSGAPWTYVENPLGLAGPPSLNSIAAAGASPVTALAVGSAGTILRWTGTAWMQEPTTGAPILLGVSTSSAVGRVAGGTGTPVWLRRGAPWIDRSAKLPAEIKDTALSLRSVWSTTTYAFAVGDLGKIVAAESVGSDDNTFRMEPSGTNTTLNAVGSTGTGDVFVVGNGGVVLRRRLPN